jgi:hypothetical protein
VRNAVKKEKLTSFFFFGRGGFLREVGSHFLFLVVRLLGPGEWKLQQSDIEMADRCERSLLARLLHVPSGAIVELDMATQPPASMRFEIEACSGEKVFAVVVLSGVVLISARCL